MEKKLIKYLGKVLEASNKTVYIYDIDEDEYALVGIVLRVKEMSLFESGERIYVLPGDIGKDKYYEER